MRTPPFGKMVVVFAAMTWFVCGGLASDAQASVQEGRRALELQTPAGLQTAYNHFASAAAANPSNAEANLLKAATLLALEATKESFRAELQRAGITVVSPNIYNFVYEYPEDSNGHFRPADGAMSDAALFYILSRRSAVDQVLTSLGRITDEDFRTSLSAAETSLAPVKIDFADVCLLRALLNAAKAAAALAESYNLSAEYALFSRLATEGQLKPQEVLAALPSALRHSSKKAEREKSRALLLAAHAEFKKAYNFVVVNKRTPSTTVPYLFEFADPQSAEQLDKELEVLAASISGPASFPVAPTGDSLLSGQRLDLSRLFSSAAPAPRDLFPRYFDRGFFRRGAASWPDRTLGGVLPDATPEFLDRFLSETGLLQSTLYHPYVFSLLIAEPEPAGEGDPSSPDPIFGEIAALAADPDGNLYVADSGDRVIRKVDRDGTVTTVAGQKWRTWEEREELIRRAYAGGTGDGGYIRTWNEAPSDIFTYGPRGIACDSKGNVYFTENNRVMRLASDGRVTTLAGGPGSSSNYRRGRDGVGAQAVFISPDHLACDADGNVYVSDTASVRRVTPSGAVTTLVGISGWDNESRGYVDGSRGAARFGSDLRGIVVDASGNIFVNDIQNTAIRKIQTDGTTSTVAGGPNAPWRHLDAKATGSGLVAGLPDARGLALAPGGLLVFGDGATVRGLLPDGMVATLGGHPDRRGLIMGAGEQARFPISGSRRLRHFAIDTRGTIYAASSRGDIVRGVPAVTLPGNTTFPTPTPYPQPSADERQGPPWPAVPTAPDPEAGAFGPFVLSTSNIVLSGSDTPLVLDGTYQGELESLSISFSSPSSGRSLSFSFYSSYYRNATEPYSRNRVLSMLQKIPSYWPEGEWTVNSVNWRWRDGSSGWMSQNSDGWDQLPFANLSFTVQNNDPDTKHPQIISLEARPGEARSNTAEDQELVLMATMTDDISGLDYAYVSFRNQVTGQNLPNSASFDLFAIDPADGAATYRALVRIPAGTEAADWSISNFRLADLAGNSIDYIAWHDTSPPYGRQAEYAPLPEHLQGAFFKTTPDAPIRMVSIDRQPPVLTDVAFEPSSVDVTASHAEVAVRLRLTDNRSGVRGGSLSLASPDYAEHVQLNFSSDQLIEGNVLDGVFLVRATLPRGAKPGSWKLNYLSFYDWEYNNGYLNEPSPETLAVVADGQRQRPALMGVEVVLPGGLEELDTWAGVQTLSVRINLNQPGPQYLDDWRSVGAVGLRSPSGTHYLWSDFGSGHLVQGNAREGTYEVVFRLPQFSEEGVWQVDYVELEDAYSWTPFYFGATEFAAAQLPAPQREFTVKGVPRSWDQSVFSLAPEPQTITIDLSNLTLTFNGAEQFATAMVVGGPPNVDLARHIVFTYDGLTTAPILSGEYDVVAFLDHLAFTGRATGKLTITGPVSGLRIKEHPAAVTAYEGESAKLAVVAEGRGALTYVWHHEGKLLPRTNRAQLTVRASPSAAGRYKVVVTDPEGNRVESREALLTVLPVAGWIWNDGDEPRVVQKGSEVILSGQVTDRPPGSFANLQWFRDGVRIPGAQGNEWVIKAADASHAGSYTVQVTTNKGSIRSNPVRLSVIDETILVYRLRGREQSWDRTGRTNGNLTGYLVLDRSPVTPQGAFIWNGSDQSVDRTELRPDLVTSSSGSGRGSRTVASSSVVSGPYPRRDHETVWLAGDDSVFRLPDSNTTWLAAPRLMTGWILTRTDDDESGVGFTVNNLTLNLDRGATSTHLGKNFDQVVEAIENGAP